MQKFYEMWEPVMKSFKWHHPDLYEDMVDWYPSGYLEITVKLRSGQKIAYEFVDDLITIIKEPKNTYISDEAEWRANFSNRLTTRMRRQGISRDTLSSRSGISTVTLSKYMNGKASPSGYNLDRICRALECSVSELVNYR